MEKVMILAGSVTVMGMHVNRRDNSKEIVTLNIRDKIKEKLTRTNVCQVDLKNMTPLAHLQPLLIQHCRVSMG